MGFLKSILNKEKRRVDMSVIYVPKGKAREYSPYACNIYLGCNHGCKYCYAPSIRFTTREKYLEINPRRNILRELESDCQNLKNLDSQVLFCFMSDPYNKLESELKLTRSCLEIALNYKIPISILTKSKSVLNDIDIIKKFGKNIQIGATLTFDNRKDSLEWEPEASTPEERLNFLKVLYENNIKTWASFEPVIIPEQSLNMMGKSIEFVDLYKIGKINNYNGIDKTIDWKEFLSKTVNIMRSNEKPFYIKKDLREAAPSVKLYGNEVLQDEFNLSKWKC
jgi:DNA repair photolyase